MTHRPIQPTIRTGVQEPGLEADTLRDQLREALSWWASGVAVLAVSDGEEVEAITVTAFSAVSLDPPLVLVCVNEQSASLPMLLEERSFTVSFLAEDDRRTAAAFAQRLPMAESRFPAEGPPMLSGSLVSVSCRLWQAYPGGDHRILVGEVQQIRFDRDAGPLLYFRREYHRVAPKPGT